MIMRYILLLFVFMVHQTAIIAQSQSFDYMDIFDLQMVANPVISPDGSTIVYVRNQFDIMDDRRYTNLWRIDFEGSNHRALTSGKSNYSAPVWSPQGDRIAFVSGKEGRSQIFVTRAEKGESYSITNLINSPSNIRWSPDGTQLLFSKNVSYNRPSIASIPSAPSGASWAPAPVVIEHVRYRTDGNPGFVEESYRQLFVVSSEGGAPRQITEGNYNHGNALWTPDGKSIVYTADKTGMEDLDPNNAQIYEMDLESGESIQLTNKRGPHNQLSLSPDGNFLAYVGYEDEFKGYQQSQLFVMQRDGSGLQKLSGELDVDIQSPVWSHDNQFLYFRYDEEGVSKVGKIDLNGQHTEVARDLGSPTIGRPYGGGAFSVADNQRVAYPVVSADRPAELAVFDTETAQQRVLTGINDALFKAKKVGKTEEIWVESSVDGSKIHSWIITPPDFDPSGSYPLILEIHGGPYQNYGPRFTPELQLMASQGYIVLYTNPRGSTSYGSDFASYINFNYPSDDYHDLMDAVEEVANREYVDGNRLYITGGSGGGVLTAWAIGKTDRFNAAVVSKPVINWYSFVMAADIYPFFTRYWFQSMPWENPEEYHQRSPLRLVGNVNTPTMLLTGELDYRTPMSESEQYYNALKLRGVDAALVRIPEAPHNIVSRPSNLIRKVGYITGWFDRYH